MRISFFRQVRERVDPFRVLGLRLSCEFHDSSLCLGFPNHEAEWILRTSRQWLNLERAHLEMKRVVSLRSGFVGPHERVILEQLEPSFLPRRMTSNQSMTLLPHPSTHYALQRLGLYVLNLLRFDFAFLSRAGAPLNIGLNIPILLLCFFGFFDMILLVSQFTSLSL